MQERGKALGKEKKAETQSSAIGVDSVSEAMDETASALAGAPERKSLRSLQASFLRVWTAVGACALFGIVCYVAGIVWQAVSVVALTAVLAFLLHGFVDWLEERRVPRQAGALAAVLLLVLVGIGLLILVVPTTVAQMGQLAGVLPDYARDVVASTSQWLDALSAQTGWTVDVKGDVTAAITDALAQFSAAAPQIIDGLMSGATSVTGAFLVAVLSLLCAYWVLADLPKISSELMSVVPEHRRDDMRLVANVLGDAVYGWVRATLLCMLITGAVSAAAFALTGAPYAMLLGVASGLLYLIPYVGPAISCAVATVVGLFASPMCAVAVFVECVVINNVVANIVSPKLMSSSMSVHPAVVIVAMLAGGAVGGIWGMLLAVPVAGAVQGIGVAFYERKIGRAIATDDGVLFQTKAGRGGGRKSRAARDALGGIVDRLRKKR